jgi:uncharacterized protein (TIGR00369 family)
MKFSGFLEGLVNARGNVIREAWDRLAPLPGGKSIFSEFVSRAVPYTGTIDAKVEELRAGHSEISMKDKRAVRNHLGSVHAIALANLAEYAGNLAVQYSMPDDARFIVAGMSMQYLKKARGTIRGVCDCPIPTTAEKKEYTVRVSLVDKGGEEVATATLKTLVGPKKDKEKKSKN